MVQVAQLYSLSRWKVREVAQLRRNDVLTSNLALPSDPLVIPPKESGLGDLPLVGIITRVIRGSRREDKLLCDEDAPISTELGRQTTLPHWEGLAEWSDRDGPSKTIRQAPVPWRGRPAYQGTGEAMALGGGEEHGVPTNDLCAEGCTIGHGCPEEHPECADSRQRSESPERARRGRNLRKAQRTV